MNIFLICILVYVIIAIIVGFVTKDIIKAIFWFFYIIGDILELLLDNFDLN
jgi:hypothetical protein